MQAMINGEPLEVQIKLQRDDARLNEEQLYVNDMCVARVTHSRSDEVPVILQINQDTAVEVDPQTFYAIEGIDHDWQPGTQADELSAL